jgi:hypothetical protein
MQNTPKKYADPPILNLCWILSAHQNGKDNLSAVLKNVRNLGIMGIGVIKCKESGWSYMGRETP